MNKTFIIAEAGVNHNGSLAMAKELIDIAVSAGADAVKFQTFQAQQLLTATAPKADYQLNLTGNQESQYEMIKKLELSQTDHETLIEYCKKKQIQFLSTPFDLFSLNLLTDVFNLPLIKIASGEITNALLLMAAAKCKKPILLSTGMSTLADVELALSILAFGYLQLGERKPTFDNFTEAYRSQAGRKVLQENVTLLHCTTDYPAAFSDVNLKALETLRYAFNLPVGYSDHTVGIEVAIAAVSCGAVVLEKHFTLDKNLPGPDHRASLEPYELRAMIQAIRHVEKALGDGYKVPRENEFKNRIAARKSLVALKPISQGEIFTRDNLGIKRPGSGIPGVFYWEWLGKTSQRAYQENDLIRDA